MIEEYEHPKGRGHRYLQEVLLPFHPFQQVRESLLSITEWAVFSHPRIFFFGEESSFETSSTSSVTSRRNETEVIINTARIEALEAEKKNLTKKLSCQKPKLFRLEEITDNDKLIRFYTGFDSYDTFLSFLVILLIIYSIGDQSLRQSLHQKKKKD